MINDHKVSIVKLVTVTAQMRQRFVAEKMSGLFYVSIKHVSVTFYLRARHRLPKLKGRLFDVSFFFFLAPLTTTSNNFAK